MTEELDIAEFVLAAAEKEIADLISILGESPERMTGAVLAFRTMQHFMMTSEQLTPDSEAEDVSSKSMEIMGAVGTLLVEAGLRHPFLFQAEAKFLHDMFVGQDEQS